MSEKKGATWQSFIPKEITTYRIGTLVFLFPFPRNDQNKSKYFSDVLAKWLASITIEKLSSFSPNADSQLSLILISFDILHTVRMVQ